MRRWHQHAVLRRFPYLGRELSRIATHSVSRLHLEGPDGRSTLIEADGYAYVFPKRDHVQHRHRLRAVAPSRADRQGAIRPAARLRRSPSRAPRRRGRVGARAFHTGPAPGRRAAETPGRGRVLLAGDAGGFVNGATAEGIYYAMVSGELAARAIRHTSVIPGFATRYFQACDYEIGAELRDSVRIQRYLFAHPQRIAQLIDGAHREKAIWQLILEFAAGCRTDRDLRRRMLLRSPRLAIRFIWDVVTI